MSDSEQAASRVALHILATIQQLAAFPALGRPGRVPGTRELVISHTPLIAAYQVAKERFLVLAIYHGAQKWPAAF